ncbi:N-acetyltransferase GCN5 [Streptomyces sp. GBA 94-10 4N24]|nr:N-acetyltransferase GCN5 [Streptomyces sp. GBA 94-10 4N24]UZN61853.1 N-acetyltransferase GCN5 [Streptomyces sp. GBA 94-10 4N24]
MYAPEEDAYPAHLHIDLLPGRQRQGHGRRLTAAYLAALRARRVGGVHPGLVTGNTPARPLRRRPGRVQEAPCAFATEVTSAVSAGTGVPERSAWRSRARPMASISTGRPAAASRCMEERIPSGALSNLSSSAEASAGTSTVAASRANSSSTEMSSPRCSLRTVPTGAACRVVSRANGARKASLSQSRAVSSSRTRPPMPASSRSAPSAATRAAGAAALASSIRQNGVVCSMTPGAVRVDSAQITAGTTCPAG